jgi:hypothetical protein
MTPLASVAMLEKLALLKIALCSAPALTIDSSVCPCMESPGMEGGRMSEPVFVCKIAMGCPD